MFRALLNLIMPIFMPVLILATMPLTAQADRLKDMTSIAGVRSNQLIGYGVVVGLAGSGDGSSTLTQQSLEALISQFRINIDSSNLSAKNAAAVMITSELPAFTKPGQNIDITVSTLGAAKSLRGGTLLMTPLLGADGETYAIAQGNLVVGGLGVTGNDGSSVIVNIPTVGRIPGGAVVERMVETPFLNAENIILNLHKGDFSTASNVAEAVNEIFGDDVAVALDSASIKIRAPIDPSQRVAFLSLLENVEVEPARPAAKVIVNSRTGTIVIGGNVRVTPAVVTHGSLTVRVEEDTDVTTTATTTVADGVVTTAPGEAIETADSEIIIEEEPAKAFIFDTGTELSDIVDAINAVGAGPADLVTILEALREAGALRAQLIII
jgi:flagellar P-ring protein precursor FlgI